MVEYWEKDFFFGADLHDVSKSVKLKVKGNTSAFGVKIDSFKAFIFGITIISLWFVITGPVQIFTLPFHIGSDLGS